MTSLSKYH